MLGIFSQPGVLEDMARRRATRRHRVRADDAGDDDGLGDLDLDELVGLDMDELGGLDMDELARFEEAEPGDPLTMAEMPTLEQGAWEELDEAGPGPDDFFDLDAYEKERSAQAGDEEGAGGNRRRGRKHKEKPTIANGGNYAPHDGRAKTQTTSHGWQKNGPGIRKGVNDSPN
eukprot:jgi/Mesvir1/24084/Mv10806-RA.1